jgi:hypothetical protein
MATHFIAMAGLYGCIPQCREAFPEIGQAAMYLAEIHELDEEQTAELEHTMQLELDVFEYGNDYCKIEPCNCHDPKVHSDSGEYDDA